MVPPKPRPSIRRPAGSQELRPAAIMASPTGNTPGTVSAISSAGPTPSRAIASISATTSSIASPRTPLAHRAPPAVRATSIGYDVLGDITSKSDVGTYAYPAAGQAHPHAFVARSSPPDCFVHLKAKRSLPSIAGTVNGVTNPSFAYDANGNMTSGAGRTISWTAFNMASQITQGARIIDQALEPQPGLEKEHRNHAWSPCRRALPCGAQQQLCGLKRVCCSQLFSHCRHVSPPPSIRRRLGPPSVAPLKTRDAGPPAVSGPSTP